MAFKSSYVYLLNFNYGKVVVGHEQAIEYVSAYNQNCRPTHFRCTGDIDYSQARELADLELGYITPFFGSPGYKEIFEFSWKYPKPNHFLLGFVTVSDIEIITQDQQPLFISEDDANYANLLLPERKEMKNNVVHLSRREA